MALEILVAGSAANVKPLNDNFDYLDGRVNTVSSSVSTAMTNIGTLQSSVSALQADSLPAGTILLYGKASAPTGWLICDGSAVSRTTYATLFSAIGTTFGAGDGSTTFNLPNAIGRYTFGTTSIGSTTSAGTAWVSNTNLNHRHTVMPIAGGAVAANTSYELGDHSHTYTAGVNGLGLLPIIKY